MIGRCRLPSLSRFGVGWCHEPRFPKSRRALASPLRFSAFRTRQVQSGVWRRVKCSRHGSTDPLDWRRRPLKGGGRNVGASRSCQRMSRLLLRSADLPRRTASIGSSSAAGHAPRLLSSRGVPLPAVLRTARPGRRSAADCSATSPRSAALMGFKCSLRSFNSRTGRRRVSAMLTRMPFHPPVLAPIVFIGRPLRQLGFVMVKLADVSRGCGGCRLPGFAPFESRRASARADANRSCHGLFPLAGLRARDAIAAHQLAQHPWC